MFEPGTQIGRYEIQRRLGRGGMGTVYVAHDPVLGRMVAIKVFAGDLDVPDARERFAREARAAAALSHSNIVTVYDFGEYASQPYIVMEYVPGDTMANVIRRKVPVSTTEKLRWIEELCAGAAYAHQMLVVHRDIKPANLMIDRSGRLKILDFGIARILGIASNTAVTIGTPGYMAPEQITGDQVDHRADQFSIGVVFYELLAYQEAFAGDTLPMITHKILTQEPAPLDTLVPDVSQDVVAIVRQALRKSSADRFKDTETMRLAIARVRRQFESDEDWNRPTMPVNRDGIPPANGTRGTGSSRRRSGESAGVAQLTPPPDPRRTDRESLARRRMMQVEAALDLARTFFEQRQLDSALDACQQALTLDETHAGAIELEQEIQTALSIGEGVEIAADDAALTVASESSGLDPGIAASRLLESQAVTRFDEDTYALTGVPTFSEDCRLAVARSATPQPIVAPIATPVPPRASALPSAGAEVGTLSTVKDSSVVAHKKRTMRWVAVGVLALAVVGVGVFMATRGPVPTGTLVIDAVPWANITAIARESGAQEPIPMPASTPLSLALPAGTYQITLTGPPPESKVTQVSVRVDVGATSVVPVTRFISMTAEEYFEEYLDGRDALSSPASAPAAAEPTPSPAPAPIRANP